MHEKTSCNWTFPLTGCTKISRIFSLLVFAFAACLPLMGQAAAVGAPCIRLTAGSEVKFAEDPAPCLDLRKFEPPAGNSNSHVLVVFLPGNPNSSKMVSLASDTALQLSQRFRASTVLLQHRGVGVERGLPSGAGVVPQTGNLQLHAAVLPGELQRLRMLNPGKKILLVGYSGGAAVAALVASRSPSYADAYLLVACPCDFSQPLQQASSIPSGSINRMSSRPQVKKPGEGHAGRRISMVIGTRDDSTLAKSSETFVANLHDQGINTRLTYAVGATHVSVLRSPEFFMLTQDLIDVLSR